MAAELPPMAPDLPAATPPASAVAGLTQRLARNLLMQSGTQVLGLVISVVSAWVLAHELTLAANGAFTYMLAVTYFGLTLADLGVGTILLRDVAQTPERTEPLVQTTLGLKLVMSVVPMLGAWVLALATLQGEARWSVIVYSLVLPIQAMTLPLVVLRARVLIKRAAVAEIANRLIGFVLMMAAIYSGYGLIGAASALIFGELAGLAAILSMTRGFVRPIPRLDLPAWRAMLHASKALGMVAVLAALVNRLDTFMLEYMAGIEEVGIYGAAYRLPGLLERLPLLAMATLYPLMSRLALDDPRGLRSVYHWAITRAAIVAIPIVVIVSLTAPEIIAVWQGEKFAGSVTPLRWLIWSTGCMYVSVIASNLLIALGRAHGSLTAWIVAGPVNLILNWFWIPRYGASGAAAATALSFAIAMGISLWMAERHLARVVVR
jgi:O-antigen/teichoic acid export membrane protein